MARTRGASSLRSSLVAPIAAITLLLSLGLTGIGYWTGNAIVHVMSDRMMEQIAESIRVHVGQMMDAPSRTLRRVVNTLARHGTSLDDPHPLAKELYAMLDDEPNIDWLYFSNEAGGIVSTGRLGNGTRVILLSDDFRPGVLREYDASSDGERKELRKSGNYFDARQKSWYKLAKETREPTWTEPYIGSVEPILGISLAAPARGKTPDFAGVIGIDLILKEMSDYMRGLRVGNTGRAFLIDASGQLIASSGGVMPTTVDAHGQEQHLHARDAGDWVVRTSALHLDRHPETVERSRTSGMQFFSYDDAGLGRVFGAIIPFQASGGISWLIVSALPASDFLGPGRNATYLSLAVAALVIVASLAVGFWAVGRALRPMQALIKAAHAIGGGQWLEVPETNRRDEIGALARTLSDTSRSIQELLRRVRDDAAAREQALVLDLIERKEAEKRQQRLLNELNHRVKNTLAIVRAIATQTYGTAETPEAFLDSFEARLLALSQAHDLLTQSAWQGASLRDMVSQELAPHADGTGSRFVLNGSDVHLGPHAVVTLGMVFHELATNAAKYGALSVPGGHVEVAWTLDTAAAGRRLRVEWWETGGPPVTPRRRRGFGSRLIERGLARDLSGEVRLDFPPEGVRCVMDLPLEEVFGR